MIAIIIAIITPIINIMKLLFAEMTESFLLYDSVSQCISFFSLFIFLSSLIISVACFFRSTENFFYFSQIISVKPNHFCFCYYRMNNVCSLFLAVEYSSGLHHMHEFFKERFLCPHRVFKYFLSGLYFSLLLYSSGIIVCQ